MLKSITNTWLLVQVGFRGIHRSVRPTRLLLHARKRTMEQKQTTPPDPIPRSTFLDWNYDAELYAFGARLGEKFPQDLLREAFTDQSYIHKQKKEHEDLGLDPESFNKKDNSELVTKGNVIISDVIEKYLRFNFPHFPTQGIQSVTNYLLSDDVLSEAALGIGCKDLVLTVEYPPSHATLAQVFKALVSALEGSAVASGSTKSRSEMFILDFVAPQLCNKDINEIWDIAHPWKLLTEIRSAKGLGPLEARLIREGGRNTLLSVFVVGLYDTERILVGTGIGETADIAREMATRDALKVLFRTKNHRLAFDTAFSNSSAALLQ